MDIIESKKYGLANTIDRIIYLHPILNDFPELRQKIISHEYEHQKAKGFWEQRKTDALTEIRFRDLIPVYKKKPSLFFKQHLPIYYLDNTLFIEWSLIFLYLLYLGIGTGIYFLIKAFATNKEIFWNIIEYTVGGLILVFGIYQGGKALRNYINEEASKLPEGKKDQLSNLKELAK